MTEYQSQLDRMKSAGFITQNEACSVIGRASGGNIPALFEKYGVTSVVVECAGKKPVRLYLQSDLSKIPSMGEKLPGGNENGGKLSHRITKIETAFTECHNGIRGLNEKMDALFDLIAADSKMRNGNDD